VCFAPDRSDYRHRQCRNDAERVYGSAGLQPHRDGIVRPCRQEVGAIRVDEDDGDAVLRVDGPCRRRQLLQQADVDGATGQREIRDAICEIETQALVGHNAM
jgi:hypothetical protein